MSVGPCVFGAKCGDLRAPWDLCAPGPHHVEDERDRARREEAAVAYPLVNRERLDARRELRKEQLGTGTCTRPHARVHVSTRVHAHGHMHMSTFHAHWQHLHERVGREGERSVGARAQHRGQVLGDARVHLGAIVAVSAVGAAIPLARACILLPPRDPRPAVPIDVGAVDVGARRLVPVAHAVARGEGDGLEQGRRGERVAHHVHEEEELDRSSTRVWPHA